MCRPILQLPLMILILFVVIQESLNGNIKSDFFPSIKPGENGQQNEISLDAYLLPETHPLHKILPQIFVHHSMYDSVIYLKKAGFKLLGINQPNRTMMKVLVAEHPQAPNYLFKKFFNIIPKRMQLKNYIKRIRGSEKIRATIQKYGFKHLVVPHKWLYELPKSFSKRKNKTYLLVVEKLDIHDDWDNPKGKARKLYYNMDKEVLHELCTLLHALGGCDAFPRNQPFTRAGKIAFIDTEEVEQKKGHFIKNIVPALKPKLQAYATALWEKLEEEAKTANSDE